MSAIQRARPLPMWLVSATMSGPRVALGDLAQQRRQRHPARIVVAPFEPAGAHFPLAVVVVVDADEIERLGAAAELGQERALEHVPGLPLVLGDLVGAPRELGRMARRRDVDERLDVEEARLRILGADRLDAAKRGADEAPLRFPADVACGAVFAAALVDLAPVGVDQVGLRDRPGEKADLVDRRVDPGPSDAPRRARAAAAANSAKRSAKSSAKRSTSSGRP
jgi:hypothetical protein